MTDTTVTFTDDEYNMLMDALWAANAKFEHKDMMDKAYECMRLWKMLYKIRYTQTEEVK